MASTQCGHIFHNICIRKWLKLKRQCPFCLKKAFSAHKIYLPPVDQGSQYKNISILEVPGQYGQEGQTEYEGQYDHEGQNYHESQNYHEGQNNHDGRKLQEGQKYHKGQNHNGVRYEPEGQSDQDDQVKQNEQPEEIIHTKLIDQKDLLNQAGHLVETIKNAVSNLKDSLPNSPNEDLIKSGNSSGLEDYFNQLGETNPKVDQMDLLDQIDQSLQAFQSLKIILKTNQMSPEKQVEQLDQNLQITKLEKTVEIDTRDKNEFLSSIFENKGTIFKEKNGSCFKVLDNMDLDEQADLEVQIILGTSETEIWQEIDLKDLGITVDSQESPEKENQEVDSEMLESPKINGLKIKEIQEILESQEMDLFVQKLGIFVDSQESEQILESPKMQKDPTDSLHFGDLEGLEKNWLIIKEVQEILESQEMDLFIQKLGILVDSQESEQILESPKLQEFDSEMLESPKMQKDQIDSLDFGYKEDLQKNWSIIKEVQKILESQESDLKELGTLLDSSQYQLEETENHEVVVESQAIQKDQEGQINYEGQYDSEGQNNHEGKIDPEGQNDHGDFQVNRSKLKEVHDILESQRLQKDQSDLKVKLQNTETNQKGQSTFKFQGLLGGQYDFESTEDLMIKLENPKSNQEKVDDSKEFWVFENRDLLSKWQIDKSNQERQTKVKIDDSKPKKVSEMIVFFEDFFKNRRS